MNLHSFTTSARLALLATTFLFGGKTVAEEVLVPLRTGPLPRETLLRNFTDLRLGVMMHFNMGTFAGKEWSHGNESPAIFNPAKLDCGQWARAAKAAGAKYAFLTTKHHDGFCLWDSKTTKHDVASSPFKRDIVREYMDAFRKEGITPCLYFSIWDRNAGVGEGKMTPAKLQLVLDQLTELLTNYGEVPALLIDGWCWKMGQRDIPYETIRAHVKKLQPNCLLSDHTHVQSPWNVDVIYFEGPMGEFPSEKNPYASQLALTCTNGWFWHPGAEKKLTMSADTIVEKIRLCEARHCNYMVNFGPNRDGHMDNNVVELLRQVGQKWKPNTNRAALPKPAPIHEYPYTAASVEAEGDARLLIDARSGGVGFNTIWTGKSLPSRITLDLGTVREVGTLSLLPQQFAPKEDKKAKSMNPDDPGYAAVVSLRDIGAGRISKYRILAGESKDALREVASGEFADTRDLTVVEFPPVKARFVTLEALATRGGKPPIIDEIAAGGPNAKN